MLTKRIEYSKEDRDYAAYVSVDGGPEEYIGSAPTWHDAELKCDDHIFGFYQDAHTPEVAASLIMQEIVAEERHEQLARDMWGAVPDICPACGSDGSDNVGCSVCAAPPPTMVAMLRGEVEDAPQERMRRAAMYLLGKGKPACTVCGTPHKPTQCPEVGAVLWRENKPATHACPICGDNTPTPDLLTVCEQINAWLGTDDGYQALPFEPPWYGEFRKAISQASLCRACQEAGEGMDADTQEAINKLKASDTCTVYGCNRPATGEGIDGMPICDECEPAAYARLKQAILSA